MVTGTSLAGIFSSLLVPGLTYGITAATISTGRVNTTLTSIITAASSGQRIINTIGRGWSSMRDRITKLGEDQPKYHQGERKLGNHLDQYLNAFFGTPR